MIQRDTVLQILDFIVGIAVGVLATLLVPYIIYHPEPRPLIPVLGACCLEDQERKMVCFTVTKEKCDERGGDYLGDNVACNPEPCE